MRFLGFYINCQFSLLSDYSTISYKSQYDCGIRYIDTKDSSHFRTLQGRSAPVFAIVIFLNCFYGKNVQVRHRFKRNAAVAAGGNFPPAAVFLKWKVLPPCFGIAKHGGDWMFRGFACLVVVLLRSFDHKTLCNTYKDHHIPRQRWLFPHLSACCTLR